MRRWTKAIFTAPAWGALAAVVFSVAAIFVEDRHRESYWPIITELWLFALSYAGFAIVNLLIGVPLSALSARATSNVTTGIAIGLCQGLLAAYFGMAAKLFPNQFGFFHPQLWFAVIYPLLIAGFATFYYLRHPEPSDTG